jgi:hypothetical protein
VTTTLHAAAAFLWGDGSGRRPEWDWFINLSASDYPLVTQDGACVRAGSPSPFALILLMRFLRFLT